MATVDNIEECVRARSTQERERERERERDDTAGLSCASNFRDNECVRIKILRKFWSYSLNVLKEKDMFLVELSFKYTVINAFHCLSHTHFLSSDLHVLGCQLTR